MRMDIDSLRRALVVVSVGVSLYYLIWRLGTLNKDAMFFSLLVYGAEVYGFLAGLMFFFMVWKFPKREPKSPKAGLKVDVYIPTYNESPDILKKTIQGALAIEYPHKTYVLDDKNRPEIRRLCAELGCEYIARDKNTEGKAGNLNNALQSTEGDFIAIFDADHVPEPDFLHKTLGYFEDEKVAFVQTPQDFYNIDSYEHRVAKGKLWHEESLFYKVILRGKDRINSAFFCGSCAVIRREALKSIGGFATGTVTEDIHTAIRLHAKGWKSVYHPETLAYGVAPSTFSPYRTQRERWGKGAMQILFSKENPIFRRGLSLPQRISYLASMTTYFDGFQKAIYYTAPAVVLLTGIFPISVGLKEFLPVFLPHILLSLWAFDEMSRGHGKFLLLEQYNMARFFTFIKSVFSFLKRKTGFRVTSKENGREVPLREVLPQLGVLSAGAVGILYALVNFKVLPNKDLYVANMFWASLNTGIAGACLFWTLHKRHQRERFRFPANFPAIARIKNTHTAVTVEDLHERGTALLSQIGFERGENIEVQISFKDRKLNLKGEVLYSKKIEESGLFKLGVRFNNITPEEEKVINLFNFRFLLKKYMEKHDKPSNTPISLVVSYLKEKRPKRRTKRLEIHRPGLVFVNGDFVPYTTEDISEQGLRILTYKPIESRYISLKVVSEGEESLVNGEILWSKEINFYGIKAYRYGVVLVQRPSYDFGVQDMQVTT
ncbi:cellulose synthase (UDP-forming) [Hydrogenivirga caldilitoris]|uniref:Cellulose synthase (UDP-forming) n=1 Tax=Hydrogenivirga caldilitoris TaxID=246264 RepID=A0A497XP97_9AQUI|nr:glycosyltransferase [Hydrogenivirga caldilitoris]RLJ70091.1 cellulose synthase (UDP-forming) [Hydrogenivirga caldilitoris]